MFSLFGEFPLNATEMLCGLIFFLMFFFIHGRPFGQLYSITTKYIYKTSYIHVAKPVMFLAIPVQALIIEANSIRGASRHLYEATLNNLFGEIRQPINSKRPLTFVQVYRTILSGVTYRNIPFVIKV